MRVNFGSTAPIIDMATRERIDETLLNGAHGPKASAGHRSAASPPPAGHNSGATAADVAAKENLRRGLYRSQRDALIAVARDPRCTKRHSLVHAIVVGFMNADTGMAFPGWRTIAEKAAIFPGNVPDPAGAYDASTIYNLLSDLRRWGYLLSVKRGPEGGGRAIAHYGIAEPPYEKLQEEITKFIMKGRARAREDRERLDALAARQSDLTTPSEDKSGSDLTRVREDRSDLTRGRAADLTRGRATVTCIDEPEENSTAAPDVAAHATHAFDDPGRPPGDSGRSKRKPKATEEQFTRFWAAYPKHDGKAKAMEKFLALSPEDAEQAITAAAAYATKCRAERIEAKFIKWAQGWLSDRRFEDFASDASVPLTLQQLAASGVGKAWLEKLGPEKGMAKLRSLIANGEA